MDELTALLPLIMVGAVPRAGTAGRIGFLPFTGVIVSDLPCCAGAEPPTATGGIEFVGADVGENGFLVALA